MGHLIGLDHTCFFRSPTRPATPAPRPRTTSATSCPTATDAPADVQATTMFASAIPGDTAKRTLAPDDIAGVCEHLPGRVTIR